jgi:hypothetical protein
MAPTLLFKLKNGFTSNDHSKITPIEILGATLEEACLKKVEFFQLISTLFCEVKRGFVDR